MKIQNANAEWKGSVIIYKEGLRQKLELWEKIWKTKTKKVPSDLVPIVTDDF